MCKWLVFLLAGGALQAAIIKGSVVENQTGKALARTLVSIQPLPGGAGPTGTVRTNSYGMFEFVDLPAGGYLIQAARRGFMPAQYGQKNWRAAGQPVVLDKDQSTFLSIRLARFSSISGIIVDENDLTAAPRIVAAQEGRVLLTRGDRAYARGQGDAALIDVPGQKQKAYRVFRNATPLKDPITKEILGYEAQYVGKALLVRSESTQESSGQDGKLRTDIVPATIDIVAAKEEMRVGDRLLPEPPQQLRSYVPHAPQGKVDARIVSMYGSAVVNAAQNQVVVINRGSRDGIENGQVMAIMKDGPRLIDQTDPARTELKLPDERNGLLMVFRTFEKLSYALVLDITDGVKVGDHLVNPR